MLGMFLDKKSVVGKALNSRELTAEELTQVSGAWGASDSGWDNGNDNWWDWTEVEANYYFEEAVTYFETMDFSEQAYTFTNDPQISLTMNGEMQVVTHTSQNWSQDEKAEYDHVFNTAFNECMDGTSTLSAVSMALGGSVAGEYADSKLSTVVLQENPTYVAIIDAIKNFHDRAGNVGYKYAYCEGKALQIP